MNLDCSFHHLGILTPSISESVQLYVATFQYTENSPVIKIPPSGIQVCSLEKEASPRIELIEPLDENSSLGKMAASSTGGYHLGWTVSSLEATQENLEAKGFHGMAPFSSPLWGNSMCIFMVGPNRELVEFIEKASEPSTIPTS